MTLKILWFIPTHGDSRNLGTSRGGRQTDLAHFKQVAKRIREYADLGLEYFVLSGYPHLEAAYRFAELVFPLLPLGLREQLSQPQLTGPFGEIMANTCVPQAATAAH